MNIDRRNVMFYVTIILPVYNERRYIKKCLNSIIDNDYPKDKLELLIIDGGSNDGTLEIIREYACKYNFIKILHNPYRYQVYGLNIGIREAKGEIIIRMDAHTEYAKDYISKIVRYLITKNVGNVGGQQFAVGETLLERAIAIALTHPFGIGNAKFRYSQKQEFVDTVYLGAWFKKTLEELGGFNEEWLVNEDYELNFRLRKKGYKILYTPDIQCRYYVRNNLRSLAKQYFRYGFWKVKTLVVYPESLQLRQLVPPIFVIAFIFSIGVGLFSKFGLVLPLSYFLADFLFSVSISIRHGIRYFPLLIITFPILHFSWGIGFILGLFRWGIPKVNFKILKNTFKF